MARYEFNSPAGLVTSTRYRIDTSSGGTTAAAIQPLNTGTDIAGSIVQTDDRGQLPDFVGSQATVYAKQLTAAGTVTGSPTAIVGVQLDVPAPDPSATYGSISLALGKRRLGHAVIGDSISSYLAVTGNAWHRQISAMAGIRYAGESDGGGLTLEDGEATLLPALLTFANAEVITIALGTNNAGSAGWDFTAAKATHARLRATIEASGAVPGLWTLPPRDDDTNVNTRVQQWNAYIWQLRETYGYPIVDAHSVLVDPLTGLYKTALKLDAIHPNQAGHNAIALAAASDTRFTRAFKDNTPKLSASILDYTNLWPGAGLFLVDTNADGLSDNHSNIGSGSYSRNTTGAVGYWQRMNVSSGASSNPGFWRTAAATTPGRTYEVSGRFHVDLDTSLADNDFGISCQFVASAGGGGAVVPITAPGQSIWLFLVKSTADRYGYFSKRFTAPVGSLSMRIDSSITTGGTLTKNVYGEVSQMRICDVTDLAA